MVMSSQRAEGQDSPCGITDLFSQGFWMEILFHFLDWTGGREGGEHLRTPPEVLPSHRP